MTAIVARGLVRRFGEVVAVAGIDLDVPERQIYGFLGPNGSGKSTAFRMICGLLLPTEGSVWVLGHDARAEPEKLRRRVGYMTQRFSLWEDLTVRENLEFLCRVFGLSRRDTRARVAAHLREYELEELAGRFAGTLSGGQKQRLALAAATLHGPELLLLDEPTSAVDPQSRRDFWEKLFDLVAAGTTILVSTHYMDEAERCHRVAILDRGRVAAEGPPRQLAREVAATVLEVECGNLAAARRRLAADASVKSVTQLGNRLHVLVARDEAEPAERLRRLVLQDCPDVQVERVAASLEDVFVAATGRVARAPAPAAGEAA